MIVQIVLQVVGVGLLLLVYNYKAIALVILIGLSFPFAYINAKYVNYENPLIHVIIFVVFWMTYGILINGVKSKFQGDD